MFEGLRSRFRNNHKEHEQLLLIDAELPVDGVSQEVQDDFKRLTEEALALGSFDMCIDPESSYPPPLVVGASVYRDPKIWSPDWRTRLPQSSEFALKPGEEPITTEDPSYVAAIELTLGAIEKYVDPNDCYRN